MKNKLYSLLRKIGFTEVGQTLDRRKIESFNSENYWIERYNAGNNSGCGSYNHLAQFKAEVLNQFVDVNKIKSVIEYGCGDGNQLKLANYPNYLGFDVSPKAIDMCQKIFANDETKKFKLYQDYSGESAELTLSLDVIYHLVENDVYEKYMKKLFDSSTAYVIIYSSNNDEDQKLYHIKHRKFTDWVDQNCSKWQLLEYILNKYPSNGNHQETSRADFYIYHCHNSLN